MTAAAAAATEAERGKSQKQWIYNHLNQGGKGNSGQK